MSNIADILTDRATDPETWKTSAANFLASCPQLYELRLGFGDSWDELAIIFEHIVKKAVFPHLVYFELDWLPCKAEHLLLFLNNHKKLQALIVKGLDIIGNLTFKEILEHLQLHHSALQHFECNQIAQNSFRVYFDSRGVIAEEDHFFEGRGSFRDCFKDFKDTFYWDFVGLTSPCKYHGVAEEWEGVRDKIGILIEDLRIDEREHAPAWRYFTWQP